jgi:hypothetical protein
MTIRTSTGKLVVERWTEYGVNAGDPDGFGQNLVIECDTVEEARETKLLMGGTLLERDVMTTAWRDYEVPEKTPFSVTDTG